jgi:hypothetical protein
MEAISRSRVGEEASRSLARTRVRHARDGRFYEDEGAQEHQRAPKHQIHTERLSKTTGRGTNGGRAHCKGCAMISIPRLPKRVLGEPSQGFRTSKVT